MRKQQQTAAARQQVWELYCAGLPNRAIADRTGLSQQTIDKYLVAARKTHPASEN
jgi:DNA-binding NarL/FixJ family response regulator